MELGSKEKVMQNVAEEEVRDKTSNRHISLPTARHDQIASDHASEPTKKSSTRITTPVAHNTKPKPKNRASSRRKSSSSSSASSAPSASASLDPNHPPFFRPEGAARRTKRLHRQMDELLTAIQTRPVKKKRKKRKRAETETETEMEMTGEEKDKDKDTKKFAKGTGKKRIRVSRRVGEC